VKLLFDQDLSRKLLATLSDLYPDSTHVSVCGLERGDDASVWDHAKDGGYAIVSKDIDFHQRAFLYGPPPKVVWIRLGNCSTWEIESLLRVRADDVEAFGEEPDSALLVLP